jgi:hypothetical protein
MAVHFSAFIMLFWLAQDSLMRKTSRRLYGTICKCSNDSYYMFFFPGYRGHISWIQWEVIYWIIKKGNILDFQFCHLTENSVYYLQAPNYPDSGRCWDIVDKYKVAIFYTAPTLVRSLMRDGDEVSYVPDLTCISVGEIYMKSCYSRYDTTQLCIFPVIWSWFKILCSSFCLI